jgi:hypothetical protein
MKALRGYDWQLSGAGRAGRIVSDDFDALDSAPVGFKQELLSAIAVAGFVVAAVVYALL